MRVRDRREAILSVGGRRLATYYVYIMTNRTRRLYIGVTYDLGRRVCEHKHRLVPGFTANTSWSAWCTSRTLTTLAQPSRARKQLKGWRRSKKIALIQKVSPQWSDLSRDLIE